jgi:hypothetical protein
VRCTFASTSYPSFSISRFIKLIDFQGHMQLHKVPLYMPASAPYKILDIGRAVRLLQQPSSSTAHLQQPSASGDTPEVGTGVEGQHSDLLTQKDIAEFSEQLRRLAAAPSFNGASLARTVDQIHDKVLLLDRSGLGLEGDAHLTDKVVN